MAREISDSKQLAIAVGETADTADQIKEMLEDRSAGEGSEMELALEQIAEFLEQIDSRLERIELALNISEEPHEGD